MLRIIIKIDGRIDSKSLWEQIEDYGVNLTDLGDYSLIYGDVSFVTLVGIMGFCSTFEKIEITCTRIRG